MLPAPLGEVALVEIMIGMIGQSRVINLLHQGERFPGFTEPDSSYHGITFGDLPAPFVTRVRTLLLRDEGAAISPFNAFILLQGA